MARADFHDAFSGGAHVPTTTSERAMRHRVRRAPHRPCSRSRTSRSRCWPIRCGRSLVSQHSAVNPVSSGDASATGARVHPVAIDVLNGLRSAGPRYFTYESISAALCVRCQRGGARWSDERARSRQRRRRGATCPMPSGYAPSSTRKLWPLRPASRQNRCSSPSPTQPCRSRRANASGASRVRQARVVRSRWRALDSETTP
jgi:hypothetical protein